MVGSTPRFCSSYVDLYVMPAVVEDIGFCETRHFTIFEKVFCQTFFGGKQAFVEAERSTFQTEHTVGSNYNIRPHTLSKALRVT